MRMSTTHIHSVRYKQNRRSMICYDGFEGLCFYDVCLVMLMDEI